MLSQEGIPAYKQQNRNNLDLDFLVHFVLIMFSPTYGQILGFLRICLKPIPFSKFLSSHTTAAAALLGQ